jgi:hypothetical protein
VKPEQAFFSGCRLDASQVAVEQGRSPEDGATISSDFSDIAGWLLVTPGQRITSDKAQAASTRRSPPAINSFPKLLPRSMRDCCGVYFQERKREGCFHHSGSAGALEALQPRGLKRSRYGKKNGSARPERAKLPLAPGDQRVELTRRPICKQQPTSAPSHPRNSWPAISPGMAVALKGACKDECRAGDPRPPSHQPR